MVRFTDSSFELMECPGSALAVSIVTGSYFADILWILTNDRDGKVILSRGRDYTVNSTYSKIICVDACGGASNSADADFTFAISSIDAMGVMDDGSYMVTMDGIVKAE